MRKYIILCLMAIAMVGITSCTVKNEEECKFHSKSFYLRINQSEWKFDDQAAQFYAHFNIPDLTAVVYNNGNYSLHRIYEEGTSDEYQVALPETVYLIEPYTDSETGEQYEYYFQQHVNYRVGIGYVEIQVTNSDYMYEPGNPEQMDFHLQLVW